MVAQSVSFEIQYLGRQRDVDGKGYQQNRLCADKDGRPVLEVRCQNQRRGTHKNEINQYKTADYDLYVFALDVLEVQVLHRLDVLGPYLSVCHIESVKVDRISKSC